MMMSAYFDKIDSTLFDELKKMDKKKKGVIHFKDITSLLV